MSKKITYVNKETLYSDPSIMERNKITAGNMNEIKNTINSNADELDKLQDKTIDYYSKTEDLEQKYEEQIKNMGQGSPQLPEIVDARQGLDTLGNNIKKKIYFYENVDTMKKASNLKQGDVVRTLGYYEANDGGAGEYRIIMTTKEDDGGSIIKLDNGFSVELIIENTIFPEQFGAIGDGEVDDTVPLQKCFALKNNVTLSKTYKYSKNINIYNSFGGNGKLICDSDEKQIIVNANNIEISNFILDYKNHNGRAILIENSQNVKIENCTFKNFGSEDRIYENTNTAILIRNNCKNIDIVNCNFKYSAVSQLGNNKFTSFIWIQNSIDYEDALSQNILVDNCIFEDCLSIEDGDAIKVLGGNYDCNLTVSKCTFKNCTKRAMKFQGRQCHSENNYIYYSKRTMYPIDFQRGYGSSTNDTIILDYNGDFTIEQSSGFAYHAISMAQGNININGLTIKNIGNIKIPNIVTASSVFEFNYFDDYDVKILKNIFIKNCDLSGFCYLFSDSKEDISIENLNMENISFAPLFANFYPLNFKNHEYSKCSFINIDIKKDQDGGDATRFALSAKNVKNSYFETNLPISRLFLDDEFINNNNNTFINHNTTFTTSNFEKKNNKMIVYLTSDTNPSESEYNQYAGLRFAPIGTIAYCNTFRNNNDGTYTIGYISITKGTGTKAGTFVPIKVNVS